MSRYTRAGRAAARQPVSGSCPSCGARLLGAEAVGTGAPSRGPAPGDVGVCGGCGALLGFTEGSGVRLLRAADRAEVDAANLAAAEAGAARLAGRAAPRGQSPIRVEEILQADQFTVAEITEGGPAVVRHAAAVARDQGLIGPGPAPSGLRWVVLGQCAGGILEMIAGAFDPKSMPSSPFGTEEALALAARQGHLAVLVAFTTGRGVELSICALAAADAPPGAGWVRVVGPAIRTSSPSRRAQA